MSILPANSEPADEPGDALNAALVHLAEVTAAGQDIVRRAAAGTDLVPAGGEASAVATRAQLAQARVALTRHQAEIAAAQERVRAELDKQLAAAMEALEPMTELVKRMEEGIWTVNLYLGREEEILTLRDTGEPAPAETPLTVRQMVLYMDEETAIGAEYGGLDARSIKDFDAWLLADPAHVDQVIPEQRAVVALKPRRNNRDYKDPWLTTQMGIANSATYFLIRNGERLYRMSTDFNVGKTLVPSRDEFLMPVTDSWGRPIEPGTKAWLDAEKAVSARERHYMRVALILQGLIDRTTILHPLPDAALSLLNPASYDTGLVRLLDDDAMTLTTGRQPFREWQRSKLALLRPGMRVVLATDTLRRDRDEDWRVKPKHASWPKPSTIHRIERRDGKKFVVLYDRSDLVRTRDDWEGKPAARRASFKFYGDERFVIPLDLVTIAECEAYLGARGERHAYQDMFPALKTAIAAKKAELDQEKPVRELIASQIVLRHGADLEAATAAAGELVEWWKTANTWNRALDSDETRAINAIVTEFGLRAAADTSGDEAAMVATLKGCHPDALLVARKRDGSWVVLTPQPRQWPASVSSEDKVYVQRTEYPKSGRGAGKVTDWWIVDPLTRGRWRVLYEGPQWATWAHVERADAHLTDPEIADLAAQLRAMPGNEDVGDVIGVVYGEHYNGIDYSLAPFIAYFMPKDTDVTLDPKRPLTAPSPKLTVGKLESWWVRKAGKPVLLTGPLRYGRTTVFAGQQHDLHIGKANEPWAELSGRDVPSPVWVDAGALAAFADMADRFRQAHTTRNALIARAEQALESIERAWLARAEAVAHDKFLQDYADPSGWDAHRRKLKLHFPYSVRWFSGPSSDGLLKLVWLLVESGVDLHGMTVADAVVAWGRPVPGQAFAGHTPELKVPEDVLDFVFDCPAPLEITAAPTAAKD